MSLLFYNIGLWMYRLGIGVAALAGNAKAKAWVKGRKGWKQQLGAAMAKQTDRKVLWMHCASLGEFEQGRPVLEAMRAQDSNIFILLSFFSPSGYESANTYSGADYICYLPMDGPACAREFVRIARPSVAVFVRYEFWYHYIHALQEQQAAVVLLSASFREEQPFFRWYGALFRKMLGWYDRLLVMDSKSMALLKKHHLAGHARLNGDTRFDRVLNILNDQRPLANAEDFAQGHPVLVAGSSYQEDATMLARALPAGWRLIIAPHNLGEADLQAVEEAFAGRSTRERSYKPGSDMDVLLIDSIGMLSRLYRLGTVAYVGGGFAKAGIHNVLEPAVYGIPVIIGPEHEKFPEAVALVAHGFALVASQRDVFKAALQQGIEKAADPHFKQSLQQWMQEQSGAAARAVAEIQTLL